MKNVSVINGRKMLLFYKSHKVRMMFWWRVCTYQCVCMVYSKTCGR